MSKGNININVSGGNSNFNNIVQGDKNKVSTTNNNALADFYSEIEQLRTAQNVSEQETAELKQEVEALINKDNQDDLSNKVRRLYEKYSWAIDPIRKLVSIVF